MKVYDGYRSTLDKDEVAMLILAPIDPEMVLRARDAALKESVRPLNACLRMTGQAEIAAADYPLVSLSVYDFGSAFRVEVFREDSLNASLKHPVGVFVMSDAGVMRCRMQ